MDFLDYREPIEYVVDRYFHRRKLNEANTDDYDATRMLAADYTDDSLPETPCLFIKDESGQIVKIIYGNAEDLESEAQEEIDIVVWQQQFIYNQNGELDKIVTTYPDGETADTKIIYDESGEVAGIE